MKRYLARITVLGLLATGMAFMPAAARAQDANTNASPNQTMTPKRHTAIPFHGKVSAVDAKAMTLTVGSRTFEITSDTKILKDDQPAALSDGVVGEPVRGLYKKTEAGKLQALSVHFGAKNAGKSKTPSSS
jgi:hypothetical protein